MSTSTSPSAATSLVELDRTQVLVGGGWRAADAVRAVKGGYSGRYADAPPRSNVRLYGDDNPLDAPGFEAKVKLLQEIDAYARAKDPRVRQVSVSFGASWQVVEIVRSDGQTYRDVRPLVRINVSVVAGSGDRQGDRRHRVLQSGRDGVLCRQQSQGSAGCGRDQRPPSEAGQADLRCEFSRRGSARPDDLRAAANRASGGGAGDLPRRGGKGSPGAGRSCASLR